ncbi:MAG: nuclear transport factor 2 family protein [Ferruginibacter sp.]
MKNVFKKAGAAFFLLISLVFLNCNCTHLSKGSSTQQIIKDYYAAYEKKDWGVMERILADGFTFTSPAGDDHINLKLYKERCWPNAYKTKKFDLEKIIIDGDDADVTYNGWTMDGKLFRNTERFKFKDGKIIENECFFGAGVSFPNNANTEK